MTSDNILMSSAFRNQLVTLIREYQSKLMGVYPSPTQSNNVKERVLVKLAEDLPPSDSFVVDVDQISKANAYHINTQLDGTRSENTNDEITLYNPSTTVSYSSGDEGYYEYICGLPCFIAFANGSGDSCCEWTPNHDIIMANGTKAKELMEFRVLIPITKEVIISSQTYNLIIPVFNYQATYKLSLDAEPGVEGWEVSPSAVESMITAVNKDTLVPVSSSEITNRSVKFYLRAVDSRSPFPHDMTSVNLIYSADITPEVVTDPVDPPAP